MGTSPPARTQRVRIDGTEVFTQQRGAGPDLVMIAGLGDSHEAWTDIAGPLAETFRVTTLDNRGVGYSPLGDQPLSVARFAADVLEVMSAWEIDRAHVIGSSMGGAIAQEVAVARPDALHSLTLVGTWRRPDAHLSKLLSHLCRLVDLIEQPRELQQAMALWVYAGEAHADGTVDRLINAALSSRLPEQTADAFTSTAQAAVAHDMGGRLEYLDVPTLIVVGGEDRICPQGLSEDLHHAIAESQLRVLPRRGHQPFQENPAEFMKVLGEFWSVLADRASRDRSL